MLKMIAMNVKLDISSIIKEIAFKWFLRYVRFLIVKFMIENLLKKILNVNFV